MTYKHFYRTILLKLVIIIALAGITTFMFFEKQNYPLSVIFVLLLIGAVVNIIRYFNHLNKWMSLFLLGIENEDTTLKIPSKSGNKTIDEVYKGMNRLNELFRQTKTEINTREQYFRLVINQSTTGLFSVNESGRIININPEATKLVNLNEYHHINTLKAVDKALPDFIMQFDLHPHRSSAIFENQYGQKLMFKLSQITIKNKKIKLVAVSDITKELDNREIDAWVKLARTLSHEIMNNIAPITSLSQVILGYFFKNKKTIAVDDIKPITITNTVKGLKVIEERGLGLMNFVENYRKFTKLPEPYLKEVNLSELIENNLLIASAFAGFNKITVKKSIPKNFLFVTDATLQSQVIINMLKNATEALLSKDTPNPTLLINLWEEENFVKIEIANNGPKVPPELKEQIFVPFYTTKEGGSGIGLSLSKQIMLTMGGDIFLNPKNDVGVSFIIVLNKLKPHK